MLFFNKGLIRQDRRKRLECLGLLTGQNTPVSNLNARENLTKSYSSVENKDNTLFSSKMGKFGKIGRGLALAGALSAVETALAEGQQRTWDLNQRCGLQVKAIVDAENLQPRTNVEDRKKAAWMVADCRQAQLTGQLKANKARVIRKSW